MIKKTITIILVFLVFTLWINGVELTGEQIIQKVNEQMTPETSFAKSRMTITTTSGKERAFTFESWSKNRGEKNLVRYLEPKRVKGQATLMLNNADDIWMFFPRTQRVRKLATHAKKQKMQGSDFSYEDMGSGDAFITDFDPIRLEDEKIEGEQCFKLELQRKKKANLSYSRLVMWVVKKSYIPIVIDYYDDKDPAYHLKRLVQKNIKEIDGVPTATKSIMFNKGDNTRTEMELLEVRYDIELKDTMFTERSLKK